jgi:hypothetical protein
MNKLTTLTTLAGAMVLGPAAVGGISPATAATISYDSAGTLHYQAAPGETNRVFFQGDRGVLVVSDADDVPLEDTSGNCQPGYVSYVLECSMPSAIDADVGDGADRASAGSGLPAALPLAVRGGEGKDKLTSSATPAAFDGGAGDDEIIGGDARDSLAGGPGNDSLNGLGAADRLDGGDGNDALNGDGNSTEHGADVIDGGAGIDRIEHEWLADGNAPEPPLNVTIGTAADDGLPGEGDDIRGVEALYVNSAGGYVGTDVAEKIQVHQVTEPSTIRGNGGDDDLDASDGADRIDGGAGNDVLDGGFGDDQIAGGPGVDQIHGDTPEGECSYIYCKHSFGNDTIDARDGEADSVDCGVGTDRVVADKQDVVAGDCETVERPGGGGEVVVPDGPPAAECVVPKLKGLKQSVAERKLTTAGCTVKVKRARSRSVARGRVIKASRGAGARVAGGTRVMITVSRGR